MRAHSPFPTFETVLVAFLFHRTSTSKMEQNAFSTTLALPTFPPTSARRRALKNVSPPSRGEVSAAPPPLIGCVELLFPEQKNPVKKRNHTENTCSLAPSSTFRADLGLPPPPLPPVYFEKKESRSAALINHCSTAIAP